MAIALMFDGIDDSGSISATSIPSGEDGSIRFFFRLDSSSNFRNVFGNKLNNNSIFRIANTLTTVLIKPESATTHTLTYTSALVVGTWYDYTLTKVSGVWDIIDTQTTLSVTTGASAVDNSEIKIEQLFTRRTGQEFFHGAFQRLTIDCATTTANNRDWDPSSSVTTAGTPIVTDTIGGNNMTGVNMPTAALGQPGSAWEDLGGGGISITSLLNLNYMVEYSMKQNVAGQSIGAQMVTISDGSPFTGTVSVDVTIDNGTKTSGGGSVTHEGDGYHSYAPTQAETNGNHIAVTFSGTGALSQTIQVYTTFPQTLDNATGIADIPTVAEFNARTLVAASYFDPAADTVANVTLVGTTTANTDMRGTDSANTVVPPSVSQFNARTVVSADYFLVTDYTAPDNAGITQTQVDIAALNDISVSQILTTQMTESYAADGIAPTLAQSLFLTMQNLQDYTYIGTTQTVRKIDGAATAATYTLDDAINPTSKTRAS